MGGAALIAVATLFYQRRRSRKNAVPVQTIESESLHVNTDKSTTVGNRTAVQGSPFVVGSNNTIQISHHSGSATASDKEAGSVQDGKEGKANPSWGEVLGTILGVLLIVGFIPSFIWGIAHIETIRGMLQGNRAAAKVAFQYGRGISAGDGVTGSQATSCGQVEISCVEETSIAGSPIQIPEEAGGNWARIAVIVNYLEDGDSSRIVISTKSKDVTLDYADHRDGSINKQIEFRLEDVKAISATERSYWFPVDIIYRQAGESFPITVTVEEDERRQYSATALFEILPKQSAVSIEPKPAKPRSHPSGPSALAGQISVSERVIAIIARRLDINRGRVTPNADFEIDLGASPTEVSLILYDLEEEYGISIPKSEKLKIRTAAEATAYLEKQQGGT